MELRCPHCGVLGVVEHLDPGAVVEQIRCGFCQTVSTAPQTRWDRLRNDFDDKDQSPYFLRPLKGSPPKAESEPEDPWKPGWFQEPERRKQVLERMNTHQLLVMLRRTRSGHQANHTDDDLVWGGDDSWGWEAWVTAGEIKAVLATRPHIPNKEERRAIRRKKAKQRREKHRRR